MPAEPNKEPPQGSTNDPPQGSTPSPLGGGQGWGHLSGAPNTPNLHTAFHSAINAFSPVLPITVAYSGGADSTALLAACADKWPGQVRAVHVHHGLQTAADSFEANCTDVCRRLNVALTVQHVDARHSKGESPEDAARSARYSAFSEALQGMTSPGSEIDQRPHMALAQHADDQAETLLLALSRGAGLPGLAAMPALWEKGGVIYHRPLLAVPAAAIRAWLQTCGLPWIEDPSNTDEHYTRNRIRARLIPVLQEAFPQFRETFARSSRHAAQAQLLLDEVAAQDLLTTGAPPNIKALQSLSRARQANCLRRWLKAADASGPSAAQLDELMAQVQACVTRGHSINIKVGRGFVVRRGEALAFSRDL
jgi:tRNA(Ile)-lysidine synthase